MQLDSQRAWLTGVHRVESPNADERPSDCDVDLIVVHGISLPPGRYGGGHIAQLFTNKLDPKAHPYFDTIASLKVSAHALIERDGSVTQFVAFNRRAWHAGHSCHRGRHACNDFSIGIELEGTDEEPYELVQLDRLAQICKVIMQVWPHLNRHSIVGHADIAPGRKTDPGPAFDWKEFERRLPLNE